MYEYFVPENEIILSYYHTMALYEIEQVDAVTKVAKHQYLLQSSAFSFTLRVLTTVLKYCTVLPLSLPSKCFTHHLAI
jgi:hypothetical protein